MPTRPRAKKQQTLDPFLTSSKRNDVPSSRTTTQSARKSLRASTSDDSDIDISKHKVSKVRPKPPAAVTIVSSEESDTSPANKAIDLTSDAESQSGPSTSSSNSPLKYSIEKMKRQQRRTKVKGKHVTNSGDESGSDDDGSPVTKRTRLLESSESDDSDVMPRKRRRVIRGNVPPLPEGEELLKELELESVLEARLRAPKKSKYSQNLEKLQRAKARRSLSDSENRLGSSDSEISDDDNYDNDIIPGAIPPGQQIIGSESEDEEEDEFIVEDEEDDGIELPLEFSMKSHSDLSHHFKIICQLYVHLVVTKSSHRKEFMKKRMKDEYFSVPLSVVRRKLRGINDSMVASSIWKPGFRKRLDIHPIHERSLLDYSVPLCDACHISNRIATISVKLTGLPYDRDTFKELKMPKNSDNDDDENSPEAEYCLGRFCARRAQIYHTLMHWEYTLFNRLQSEVENVQNPARSSRGEFVRVNWGASEIPEDTSDPDQIMDWLDRRGVINDEYRKIKDLMKDASTLNAPGQED